MAWWPGENLQVSGGNVFVGPMSPQGNIPDFLNLFGNGFTSASAINADTSYVALPFDLQNWTRVERVWGRVLTNTAVSTTLTYQFGIYDEGTWNGTTWVSTLQCATATGLTPANFGNNSTIGGSAPFSSPTLLAPGVYYFTQQISNATATGATATPGATTVGKNRVMGVREAVFNSAPNTGTAMPATITWRAPGSMTSTWNPVTNFTIVGTVVT